MASHVLTQRWRDDAERERRKRKWSYTRVAQEVGGSCGPDQVSRLLKGEREWSQYAPEIARVLNTPLPNVPTASNREAEWLELGDRIYRLDENHETYIELLDAMRLLVDAERGFREARQRLAKLFARKSDPTATS